MSDRTIVVARRFRGPHDGDRATGNGGYVCGLVAAAATPPATTIEIRARDGIPLDRPLVVRAGAVGALLYDGSTLIACASAERLAVTTPTPPPLAVAREASRRFEALLEEGSVHHAFPECFVCGHRRSPGDGMRLFPGPWLVDGVARGPARVAGWRPDASLLDPAGRLRPEFVWSALDCPGGWAATRFARVERPAVLGRMAARLLEPITAQSAYIVVGWLEGVSGRKLAAGSALYSRDGVLQGFSRQTWITLANSGTQS